MKNKYKTRDFRWSHSFDIERAFILGFGIGNHQPKKQYHSAEWEFTIGFICFTYQIKLSYNYKK